MQLILASKSPRRREILENLGVRFEIVTADTDESSEESDPCRLVELLSCRKGEAVYALLEKQGRIGADTVVLSSDTVVCVDGEILGKPCDAADACRMLRLLSGRTHQVISGICLIGRGRVTVAHEVTEVEFDELSEETIRHYVKRSAPYDKAGAYAIQGLASSYIKGIKGCYFNVVGLPVHRLSALWHETFGDSLL